MAEDEDWQALALALEFRQFTLHRIFDMSNHKNTKGTLAKQVLNTDDRVFVCKYKVPGIMIHLLLFSSGTIP